MNAGDEDRLKNGEIKVEEAQLRASLKARELTVRIPIERIVSRDVQGKLKLELTRLADGRVIDSAELRYDLEEAESDELVGRVTLDKDVTEQADLVNYNLRITDGDASGVRVTRSVLTASPRYEVRLEGPARVSADKAISYRVRAHDPKTFKPVANAPVELTLSAAGQKDRVLREETDAHGDAFFALSLPEGGDYEVAARAENAGTSALVSEVVSVETGSARLLLTTDKPLYQPGQLVHLRALALDKGGNTPLKNRKVTLEISDAKGNKIYKREVKTDGYGIAAQSFRLGTVLNMGTFATRAIAGDVTSEKTFEVSRYVLPKFAVGIELDKPFYAAGETVHGRLDARYFFGKDVVEAGVKITASTLDVGQNVFTQVVGKTSAQGSYEFSFALPRSLAGIPLEQGNALVSLHAEVTDAAGQLVEKDSALVVASQAARILIVPESTTLVPGVSNQLQVFVNDPVGAPIADAEVTISIGAGDLPAVTTDAFGQAVVSVSPEESTSTTVNASAKLPSGKLLTQAFSFGLQEGSEHLIVRTDRAVYDVGDTVKLEVLTTDANGSVYVDWLNAGQAIAQHTLTAKSGKAKLEVSLDASMLGDNRIEAYVVDEGGNVSRAGRTLFVRNDAALSVELSSDKPVYEPGQAAELTFTVKDEQGNPAVAALGVQIVDEALFSLVDAKPGLLRTYFELDDAFAKPNYQIEAPPGSLSGLLFDETRSSDADANQAAQRRAQATFAALGGSTIMGIHTGSWDATISRIQSLLTKVYEGEKEALAPALKRAAARGKAALALEGCSTETYWCEAKQTDYSNALRDYVSMAVRTFDPWGNAYQTSDDAYGAFTFLTRGPDEISNSEDDGRVELTFADIGIDDVSGPGGPANPADDDGNNGGGWGEGGGAVGGTTGAGVNGTGGANGGDAGAGPPVADEPRVRRDFPETLYVNPAVITGPDGLAKVTVPLADSITSWRVSTMANSQDGKLGGSAHGLVVFQDFFTDIGFPATLTRGDEVSFPIALSNYLDVPQTVSVSLEAADWYTPLGETSATVELAANQIKGLSFPVRVHDVGLHTLTVKALGTERSDAVERAVRVVPDGKGFSTALSGALAQGEASEQVSYPANAVPGSGELSLSIYPAFLSSVVSGMESMLQAPSGCFEQTTSTTWPNVLVLRYLRDTKQSTPELELKAEGFISAGYQRLLTFEHPAGGFSWFGTQDPAPYLSVTAFGLMEFADMSAVYDVDPAMVSRTADWLANQQKPDGTWPGDMTEFFSFHTSIVRNTAFVVWSLASAGYDGPELKRALSYLSAHYKDEKQDGYTLAIVANAFALAAPNDPTLDAVLTLLDGMKKVDGDKISWDSGTTQTDFYGYGNDAAVTTTALVAHALLTTGGYADQVRGAIDFLSSSRDAQGNFGSTQATIWTLRTLLLAATKGTEGAVGDLTVSVDGSEFATVALTADQSDVMTTIDLASLASTGEHDVVLSFAGTGKVSYNLVAGHHLPWAEIPAEPSQPLSVSVTYDRKTLAINETVTATVSVQNLTSSKANMVLVDLGIPPGFEVVSDDLDTYLTSRKLSKYETTPRQLILYLTALEPNAGANFSYRLRATMPVKASDGGAKVYPYYEPDRESQTVAQTLQVN